MSRTTTPVVIYLSTTLSQISTLAPTVTVNEEVEPPTITVGVNGKTASANLPSPSAGTKTYNQQEGSSSSSLADVINSIPDNEWVNLTIKGGGEGSTILFNICGHRTTDSTFGTIIQGNGISLIDETQGISKMVSAGGNAITIFYNLVAEEMSSITMVVTYYNIIYTS